MSLNSIGYAILLVILGCAFGYYAASGTSNANNIEQNTTLGDQILLQSPIKLLQLSMSKMSLNQKPKKNRKIDYIL
jgi:hypothetical protein